MLESEFDELLGAALLGCPLLEPLMLNANVWGFDLSKPEDVVLKLRNLSERPRNEAMTKCLAEAAMSNLRMSLEVPFKRARRGVGGDVIRQQLGVYKERADELTLVLSNLLGNASCKVGALTLAPPSPSHLHLALLALTLALALTLYPYLHLYRSMLMRH